VKATIEQISKLI